MNSLSDVDRAYIDRICAPMDHSWMGRMFESMVEHRRSELVAQQERDAADLRAVLSATLGDLHDHL